MGTVDQVLQVKISHSQSCTLVLLSHLWLTSVEWRPIIISLQSNPSLTLHQQPENVTVLVRELVEEKVSPVLAEKVKWQQNVFIWL